VHAAHKLCSTELPEIKSLCIGFVDIDDSIPVHSYAVNDLLFILTIHFADVVGIQM
jgi:hypothetical protein